MLKIESNIPVPNRGSGSTSETKSTARDMKVGDSVFCADEKTAWRLQTALRNIERKTCRRKEKDGYRVWRLHGKHVKGGAE